MWSGRRWKGFQVIKKTHKVFEILTHFRHDVSKHFIFSDANWNCFEKQFLFSIFFCWILFTFQCTECCVLDVSTSIYKLRVHMARIILKSIFYTMLSSRFKTFSLQNRLMCLRKKLWPTSITALVCSIYANICGHIEYRIVSSGVPHKTCGIYPKAMWSVLFLWKENSLAHTRDGTTSRGLFFWQLANLMARLPSR